MQPVWEMPLSPTGILVELTNGKQVRIRPVRTADVELLQAAFLRLSPQSRYYRFFQMRDTLDDNLATSLTNIDHERHFAWGVFDPDESSDVDDDSGLGIAVARLIRDDDPATAEAAVVVVDSYHGQGLGRFLLELLATTAADIGVSTLRFEILRENRPMIKMMATAGATSHPNPGDPTVVNYHLAVPQADATDPPLGALYELLRHVDQISMPDS